MPNTVVLATLHINTPEDQQKVKDQLAQLIPKVKEESGSLSYYWFQSDNSDDNNLYAFEQYASVEALQAHSSDPALQQAVAQFKDTFTQAPETHVYEVVSGFVSKAGLNDARFIWLTTLRTEQREFVLERLDELTKEVEKSPDALSYAVLKNLRDPEEIVVFERYTTDEALHDVHEKSSIYKSGFSIRASFGQLINKRKGEGYSESNLGFISK
ncbi:antibiotic biosynthesis monooxygenase domain-containing protein [Planoprotostelium fungivorum]|uniref:Antibiotic biosynthesis monooxygenase domain-containing protein n=1 Tax=Planoprotostelium fungivorum TaxID=1890364 RepID=A0A2P6N851_9EUKA|nr:antibiotic biosynthesis monooxygenase domain-containing protein [Planoprotostelium fungivorum]